MMFNKEWAFGDAQYITIQGRQYNVYAACQLSSDLPIVELRIDQMYLAYVSPCKDTFSSFVSHCRAVNDADLSYPILLTATGAILDGKHRLAKAILEGRETIAARRFTVDPPACYTEV